MAEKSFIKEDGGSINEGTLFNDVDLVSVLAAPPPEADPVNAQVLFDAFQQQEQQDHQQQCQMGNNNNENEECFAGVGVPGALPLYANKLVDAFRCMSLEDKDAYMEATRKCPALIQKESSPEVYLRATNYDVQQAAKKMALYWKLRKAIIGPYKAFLPMTLNGAMSDDVKYVGLTTGSGGAETKDARNRPVFLCDRKKCTGFYPVNTRFRCFFYELHRIAQDPQSQENGFVFLENRMVCPRWSNVGCTSNDL